MEVMENQRRVVQGVQDHSLGYFTGEISKVVVLYIFPATVSFQTVFGHPVAAVCTLED